MISTSLHSFTSIGTVLLDTRIGGLASYYAAPAITTSLRRALRIALYASLNNILIFIFHFKLSATKVCFYDQYVFKCRDFRWGNFNKHCTKEYRRGETCGTKLINDVLPQTKDCTLCEKIERKTRRYEQYNTKLRQLTREGRLTELASTVEKYQDEQRKLRVEIPRLQAERENRAKDIAGAATQTAQTAAEQTHRRKVIKIVTQTGMVFRCPNACIGCLHIKGTQKHTDRLLTS
jgi:hypothetical protein